MNLKNIKSIKDLLILCAKARDNSRYSSAFSTLFETTELFGMNLQTIYDFKTAKKALSPKIQQEVHQLGKAASLY